MRAHNASDHRTPATRLLCAIIGEVVTQKKDERMPALIGASTIDWDVFKRGLGYHGLGPLAYMSLKAYADTLPPDIVGTLKATYYASLKQVVAFEEHFFILEAACAQQGLLMVPFKGMAIVEDLYAENPVRPSCDIDVLVHREDIDQVITVMEGLGFEKELSGLKESYWRTQYHIALRKNVHGRRPLVVEVHWDIDYPRKGRPLLPEKFNRLREIAVGGRKVKILSVEDTFFGLALHQRRFGQVLNLKDVCDMGRLLKKYAATFDWDYIIRESRSSRLRATVYFALFQVKFFFDIHVPEQVMAVLAVPSFQKKMIERFIRRNTFWDDPDYNLKDRFLKVHFLLYDDIWEPAVYILVIPIEQFAKFYELDPYTRKTRWLYHFSFFYVIFRRVLVYWRRLWKWFDRRCHEE